MPFDKSLNISMPPTPPMDLSDSNSNSSNDYKVSRESFDSMDMPHTKSVIEKTVGLVFKEFSMKNLRKTKVFHFLIQVQLENVFSHVLNNEF